MRIPVFHDDQHGTAIIAGAAFVNALELAGKKVDEVACVFSGAGAAALACAQLFLTLGVKREHLILLQRDPAPASAPASVHAGAAGAGAGAAATACTGGVHGGALASVGGVHGGSIWCSEHLVHCEVRSSGTELRLRACSTRPLTETSELSSELTEVVANAIACWAWAAAFVPPPPSRDLTKRDSNA
jgi:hypothetical protein